MLNQFYRVSRGNEVNFHLNGNRFAIDRHISQNEQKNASEITIDINEILQNEKIKYSTVTKYNRNQIFAHKNKPMQNKTLNQILFDRLRQIAEHTSIPRKYKVKHLR